MLYLKERKNFHLSLEGLKKNEDPFIRTRTAAEYEVQTTDDLEVNPVAIPLPLWAADVLNVSRNENEYVMPKELTAVLLMDKFSEREIETLVLESMVLYVFLNGASAKDNFKEKITLMESVLSFFSQLFYKEFILTNKDRVQQLLDSLYSRIKSEDIYEQEFNRMKGDYRFNSYLKLDSMASSTQRVQSYSGKSLDTRGLIIREASNCVFILVPLHKESLNTLSYRGRLKLQEVVINALGNHFGTFPVIQSPLFKKYVLGLNT